MTGAAEPLDFEPGPDDAPPDFELRLAAQREIRAAARPEPAPPTPTAEVAYQRLEPTQQESVARYVKSGVESEFARLEALKHDRNSYWDITCHEVSCNLIELGNIGVPGYTTAELHKVYMTVGPRDDVPAPHGFPLKRLAEKWQSAQRHIGTRAREVPETVLNPMADYAGYDGLGDDWRAPVSTEPVPFAGGVSAPTPGPKVAPQRTLRTVNLRDVTTPTLERVTSPKVLPLYLGMLHALVGPSESGKSLTAGATILDVVSVQHQKVLVLDGEMSAPFWRQKMIELGATDNELGRIYYAEMSGDAASVDLVCGAVESLGIQLVTWDSALSLISRTAKSENDNAEVGRVFDRLREIVRDGPAGLIIDHSAQGAEVQVSRGASSKFAALDVSYGVKRPKGTIPSLLDDWTTTISCEKDRHGVLGDRADYEVLFHPLGDRKVSVDIHKAGTSSHRFSFEKKLVDDKRGVYDDKVLAKINEIEALDPPPKSSNDACKRISGTATIIRDAYRKWMEDKVGGYTGLDDSAGDSKP